MTAERNDVVTMNGEPLTLLGEGVKVGDPAPEFTVVDRQWAPVTLGHCRGKTVLISSVPSVDTSVCAIQTKRFNDEVKALRDNIVVFTISQDLPFALERYCTSLDEVRHPVLSDHVEAQFGTRYGLLIKGMRLLARAIHVVAPDGRIAYVQIVPELTDEPDYDAALAATRKAAGL